jgi:SAM-dependent methyltransferase
MVLTFTKRVLGFLKRKLGLFTPKPKVSDWFLADLKEFKKQMKNDVTFKIGEIRPFLDERTQNAGVMNGHYFHQDLFVARQIFINNPVKHLDIGSRTDGFVAHVASFRTIELIDIRDSHHKITNIIFRKADLMNLPKDMIDYCDSISSLHAIEHFGLGRYGDPINYFGYLSAIENIHKMLKVGGLFYFSVPIGPQRVEFNAHRVFSISYLIEILSPMFSIVNFSFVKDNDDFVENAELTPDSIESNFNCIFGCGIFTLKKK